MTDNTLLGAAVEDDDVDVGRKAKVEQARVGSLLLYISMLFIVHIIYSTVSRVPVIRKHNILRASLHQGYDTTMISTRCLP